MFVGCWLLGTALGRTVGALLGKILGTTVLCVGDRDGLWVEGFTVGALDGFKEGITVGVMDGLRVVGLKLGAAVQDGI